MLAYNVKHEFIAYLFALFVSQWHALDRSEQAKYYEMAREERQRHMQVCVCVCVCVCITCNY